MTAPAAPWAVVASRRRPAHLSWKRHVDTCPDCLNGYACRTADGYARKADIEDGRLLGWPAPPERSR